MSVDAAVGFHQQLAGAVDAHPVDEVGEVVAGGAAEEAREAGSRSCPVRPPRTAAKKGWPTSAVMRLTMALIWSRPASSSCRPASARSTAAGSRCSGPARPASRRTPPADAGRGRPCSAASAPAPLRPGRRTRRRDGPAPAAAASRPARAGTRPRRAAVRAGTGSPGRARSTPPSGRSIETQLCGSRGPVSTRWPGSNGPIQSPTKALPEVATMRCSSYSS